MTPLEAAVSGALVQFVWQGLLVALLVSAAMFLLRRSAPNVRYFVYCLALILLTALPIVTAIALYDPLASNQPGPAAITLTIRAVWNGSASPAADMMGKWLDASQAWILPIWILGVAFFSLRLAWLGIHVSSLKRSGTPPGSLILAVTSAIARRMGTQRAIRVLVSAIPDGPSVVGWFRPVILLPAATILNLTPDQLESILAHEIAHLRRYDDVVNIVQSVIETLLFYHPAVWWISNRISHERELCCDDLAVRASGNALCYARALTALERMRVSPPRLALGASGTTGSPLEYRIRRIVDPRTQDSLPSSLPGVLALGLALACIATYSNPAHGSAPPPSTRVEYPEAARADGIQGTVPVQVKIDDLGRVSAAKAMGGPRELRQAAVESASAQRFSPGVNAGTEQLNVEFQLTAPSASAPAQTPAAAPPVRTGPRWKDQGESIVALAAQNEKDPVRQLELLRQWEQQYPATEFRSQRASLMQHALLAVMELAYGKTDPAVLDAGKKAAQQLLDHFGEYFDESQLAKARKASELQIHTILAYIAQTNEDDATAESEFRQALAIDPEQARTSYQLGATIMREMSMNNELTRYSEAIYEFARSLTITGPTALPPALKAEAENALIENYGSYHGSTDGLDTLMRLVGASALPPADFHIVSVVEMNEPARKAHAEWAAAHPDLELWETTRAALLDRADAYFAGLRDAAAPLTFGATVVSQPSTNRLVVNVDNAPGGDAILRFDASRIGAVRPGTAIQFTGVVDSYTLDPYVLTFVIRSPKDDIIGLNASSPKRNFLTRIFKGIGHLVRKLV